MVAGNKSIVDYIVNCASGSPSDQELAQLSGAIQSIENGDVGYSVACIDLLPNAIENTGRFIFVEDIGAYRYSDGFEWTNDYDTTQKNDKTIIYGWGLNTFGALGDGSNLNRAVNDKQPEFSRSTNWCCLSSGQRRSNAIKTDGTLWSWGTNCGGEIGNYLPTDTTGFGYCSPIQEVSLSTDWVKVSAGRVHSVAIKSDGSVWSWGRNSNGEIGDGSQTNRSSPVREICSANDWCFVTAGYSNTSMIKTNGTMWGMGRDRYGELGINCCNVVIRSPVQEVSLSTWCSAAQGSWYRLAIKTDGTLWGTGCNQNGVLGLDLPVSTEYSSPVQEITSSTWASLTTNFDVNSAHAIKTDGTLWSWGSNGSGNLGDGSQINRSSPVQELTSSTNWCVVSLSSGIKTDGTLWVWGPNLYCQVDLSGINRLSPIQEIESLTGWHSVYGGANRIHAILKTFSGFS